MRYHVLATDDNGTFAHDGRVEATTVDFLCSQSRGQKKEGKMLIVIGGDAAGMSAASQVRRLQPEMDITVFERGIHTSFSA